MASLILDFGPDQGRLDVGSGPWSSVSLVPHCAACGGSEPFSPGGIPEVAAPRRSSDPILVELPDGRTVVERP